MCPLFPVFVFFSPLQLFYRQLHFLLYISCFFRSSLTFISDDLKQKNRIKRKKKEKDVNNSKKQETGNKKHTVEQT